ncbi:FAD binding domain-containing protein [Acidobacteria bacterium AH-259-A15]|nr:FAD binding domain-containing protein [Acidobacteria bacterium AH-259-A15]
MQAFEYVSPATKQDAVKLLAGAAAESAVLAGGTDLLSLMKDYVIAPKRVVNIKSIKELQGIRYDSRRGLKLGVLTTLDQLLADKKIKQEYSSLWQAAQGVRSPQIQNMGTLGGDLCQRPRCWYYRNGYGLLAMQNGKSMVLEGDNRYHAILGNTGPAYFVNASSLAPALIALGSRLKIFGPDGAREVDLQDFYLIPTKQGEREYKLAAAEIVTDILVPPASRQNNATYEVRQKEALDWPLAAAAVALQMDGSRVKTARVVLGHVAPIPWRALQAEKFLAGKTIGEDVAERAGEAAVTGARPLSGNKYKIRLARVAVKRAILRATGTEV